jgi:hypothetical protein
MSDQYQKNENVSSAEKPSQSASSERKATHLLRFDIPLAVIAEPK